MANAKSIAREMVGAVTRNDFDNAHLPQQLGLMPAAATA